MGSGKAKICREKKGERASADTYMKNVEEMHGYKTLKKIYLDSISEENDKKSEETNPNTSESSISKSDDRSESESQEISKLKRDMITLKAEMKARSDKIEKNDEKMKDIRTNIIRYLQQSLSDPLFETSSMALLVTQLSMTLTEDEYEIGECGVARLNSETIFKELSLNYDSNEEAEVAKANFVAFGKAVESRMHVKMTSGNRRLSITSRTASPKRKSSDDGKLGNESKKPMSKLPAPHLAGKGRLSPGMKDKKMTLQQFHSKNVERKFHL